MVRLTSPIGLRGRTPRWSPVAYVAAAGMVISRWRTERPSGVSARAVSSRLTRTGAARPRWGRPRGARGAALRELHRQTRAGAGSGGRRRVEAEGGAEAVPQPAVPVLELGVEIAARIALAPWVDARAALRLD